MEAARTTPPSEGARVTPQTGSGASTAGATATRATFARQIIHVVHWTLDAKLNSQMTCDTLAPEDLEQIIAMAPTWRDHWAIARDVRNLAQERGWRGVLIEKVVMKAKVERLPPLKAAIEPIELTEHNPSLRHLLESLADFNNPPIGDRPLARWGRVLVRGIPSAFILAMLAQVLQHVIYFLLGSQSGDAIFVVMMLCLMTTVMLIWWWKTPTWWIVHGGLVSQRKLLLGAVNHRRLRRPEDSMLILYYRNGVIEAQLWIGRSLEARGLTRYEAAALVAAWTSPLPAPDPNRINDLS